MDERPSQAHVVTAVNNTNNNSNINNNNNNNNNSSLWDRRSNAGMTDGNDIREQLYQDDLKQSIMEPPNLQPPMARPSRAFRHFQNPPQPHMCIRHHTVDGQELFINVMSWTRIVMPQNADEPIPLYGGMRVPPSSHRSPPLVYAVMANPEILKHVGRNCPDPEKRLAVVELMCEFVEAMNPGLKLAREAEVLKDRDLSGELKDIWGAVQAKREREKEGPSAYAAPPYENHMAAAAQSQVTYMEFGPETGFHKQQQQQQQQQETISNTRNTPTSPTSAINLNVDDQQQINDKNSNGLSASSNETVTITTGFFDSPDEAAMNDRNKANSPNQSKKTSTGKPKDNPPMTESIKQVVEREVTTGSSQDDPSLNGKELNSQPISKNSPPSPSSSSTLSSATLLPTPPSLQLLPGPATTTTTTTTTTVTTPPTSTKKEKLSGFLPNGCHNIFPFIKSKNSQNKKEPKEKKSKVIDFTKAGQWKSGKSNTTSTNGSGSGGGGAGSNASVNNITTGSEHNVNVSPLDNSVPGSGKVDAIATIDLVGSIKVKEQQENRIKGFKFRDECADDMQKLKL